MNTRLLETFVAVAEDMHFGRAAKRLHITQPAVSRQIRHLEDELRVQLFVRDRRRVTLTEAGQLYLAEARTILSRLEIAQQVARRLERGEMGNLSIGYSQYFTIDNFFPAAVRLYRERFPDVELQMYELLPVQQVEKLQEGAIDVGLVWLPVAAQGLRVETLFEESIVLALPADHALASNAQVALEDLTDEPFILFPRWQSPWYHDLITSACREAGFEPRVVVEANTMQGMASMVVAGHGVSFLALNAYERPGLAYREIARHDLRVKAALAWRSEDHKPVLNGFLEVMREVYL